MTFIIPAKNPISKAFFTPNIVSEKEIISVIIVTCTKIPTKYRIKSLLVSSTACCVWVSYLVGTIDVMILTKSPCSLKKKNPIKNMENTPTKTSPNLFNALPKSI